MGEANNIAVEVTQSVKLPIARIVIDSSLPHLDRLFDYRITPEQDHDAVVGCRVKVRFSGRLTDGFLAERVDVSDHDGKLAPVSRIVSSEPVLRADVLDAARSVAHRYAGTLSDVLRLAIPPRHARAESESLPENERTELAGIAQAVSPAESLLPFSVALGSGETKRVCWAATPDERPFHELAVLAAHAAELGQGVIICVPDRLDVQRCTQALHAVLGSDRHFAMLTSTQKPIQRYRAFLRLLRGECAIAIGTRGAALAPVHHLGLVMMWDDGDDLFQEPRAPYPHAREMLLTRSLQTGASVLLGGYARTAEAQQLTDAGWCTDVSAAISRRRTQWPQLTVTDGSEQGAAPVRLPRPVFEEIRNAEGPVLVQVPRRGYRTVLACQACRSRAQCQQCGGPLIQNQRQSPPSCSWCGADHEPWRCSGCGGSILRAPIVGNVRTAEEFAQAFADRTVETSHGGSVLERVSASNVLVLATPGAEPDADGGYALVVLLDTSLSLNRDDLRAAEEAHRRWFNALALSRPGARAVAVGDAQALQALVRADPVGFAARELAGRREVHLPPAARLASIEGGYSDLIALLDRTWTPHAEVLGPLSIGGSYLNRDVTDDRDHRLVVRVPKSEAAQLSDALKSVAAARSEAKKPALRIEVDPLAF